MADSRKRWDTDHRFVGVADASAFAPAVEELAALARRPDWVAEDPEIHLVPHLRGASVDGMRIVETRTGEDGVLAVDAECDPGASRGELRRRAWVLIGTVAEPAASVLWLVGLAATLLLFSETASPYYRRRAATRAATPANGTER
jgi:hypothetical protein